MSNITSLDLAFFIRKFILSVFNFCGHLFDFDHVSVSLVTVDRDRTHLQEHSQVLLLNLRSALGLNGFPHDLLGSEVAQVVAVADYLLESEQVESTLVVFNALVTKCK